MPAETGRHFLAIPGPTVIPERVMRAMNRPMVNIYEGPLIDLTHSLFPDLKKIAKTEGDCMMYISNGHGAWDAALFNTVSTGDKMLVLESGRFAVGWGAQAEQMGVVLETISARPRGGVDPAAVEEHLRADTAHGIKAVLVVQVDTASGVRNDIEAIGKAIRAAGHPALFMVDCIACFGCVPYEMDAWGVDVTVAACQKGLMTPPGLGFVFANEKAMQRRRENGCLSGYWDWLPRAKPDMYYKLFCGTAPVNHLYGLREALDMITEEGLEAVYVRHNRLARAVRAAVAHWGQRGSLELNITEDAARSDVVTTILTGDLDAQVLRSICEDEFSLTLGLGIGLDFNRAFRIGHMGHVNEPMILGALSTIELALMKMEATFHSGGAEAAIYAFD